MNLLAPLLCSVDYPTHCGARVRVRWERWDPDFRVYVGALVCEGGHEWLDQRNDDTARPHPWVGPQQRLPFTERRSRAVRHNQDD